MMIYPHQRRLFDELRKRAQLYFRGSWRNLPLKPRFHSLVVGSTGTGKTALAGNLATVLGATLHRVSVSDWMPLGANNRGTKETLCTIGASVAANSRTLIFLDEIDKIAADTAWLTHVRTEIFDLLDGHLPPGLELDDYLSDATQARMTVENKSASQLIQELLTNRVFILAAGAFQGFFDRERSTSIGFAESGNEAQLLPDAAEIARRLPRELANRFHSHLLLMPPLKEGDYRWLSSEFEKKLPEHIRSAFRASSSRLITEAIKTQKGCRFLEEALLDAMLVQEQLSL